MTTIQGFVKLKSAILGLTPEEEDLLTPQMILEGISVMRRLGFSNIEIEESIFPDDLADSAVDLIKNDPAEFGRRVKVAIQEHACLN